MGGGSEKKLRGQTDLKGNESRYITRNAPFGLKVMEKSFFFSRVLGVSGLGGGGTARSYLNP